MTPLCVFCIRRTGVCKTPSSAPVALNTNNISSVEKQKGLSTGHLHTQVDPFAPELSM